MHPAPNMPHTSVHLIPNWSKFAIHWCSIRSFDQHIHFFQTHWCLWLWRSDFDLLGCKYGGRYDQQTNTCGEWFDLKGCCCNVEKCPIICLRYVLIPAPWPWLRGLLILLCFQQACELDRFQTFVVNDTKQDQYLNWANHSNWCSASWLYLFWLGPTFQCRLDSIQCRWVACIFEAQTCVF